MRKFLLWLLAIGLFLAGRAQESVPLFPEPEFIGQVLAVRGSDRPEQLPQESMTARRRASAGSILFGIGRERIDEMVLDSPKAVIRFRSNDDLAFIIRVPDNRIDPMSMISVFRFKVKKRCRVAEYASCGEFGGEQYNMLDRQPFVSRRFGASSYLIVLKEAIEGEYGITVNALGSLNVSTFGIDE